MQLTATQSGSPSKALTVGARLPGVILAAAASFDRSMLYWHRTCFCAARKKSVEDQNPGRALTDDTSYPRRDEINHRLICGVFGFDENCCTRYNSVNWF